MFPKNLHRKIFYESCFLRCVPYYDLWPTKHALKVWEYVCELKLKLQVCWKKYFSVFLLFTITAYLQSQSRMGPKPTADQKVKKYVNNSFKFLQWHFHFCKKWHQAKTEKGNLFQNQFCGVAIFIAWMTVAIVALHWTHCHIRSKEITFHQYLVFKKKCSSNFYPNEKR